MLCIVVCNLIWSYLNRRNKLSMITIGNKEAIGFVLVFLSIKGLCIEFWLYLITGNIEKVYYLYYIDYYKPYRKKLGNCCGATLYIYRPGFYTYCFVSNKKRFFRPDKFEKYSFALYQIKDIAYSYEDINVMLIFIKRDPRKRKMIIL